MPKLAEWHIYGNEQQGRFVTHKPETEPCYYLGGVTNDVKNKNFFRILDKKEYELKDHLGNVRVAIGDMKLPTTTPGVPPYKVDEKAINDYKKLKTNSKIPQNNSKTILLNIGKQNPNFAD